MLGEPRFPYVEATVPAEEADEAGATFFELGAQGVEVRDETTSPGGEAGKATIVASFESDEAARQALAELPPAWSGRFGEVVGDGWRDEWKKYFEPFEVCPSIVVRPPWRDYESRSGERVIVLEPGRAFGTGLHETTSLVARILADRRDAVHGKWVLDVGCGSGVLGLVALELGAAGVRAIDVDPDAVAVTRENAARNGRSEQLRADGEGLESVSGTFDVVLANIEHKTLVHIASALAPRVSPGGWLVLSGILGAVSDPRQWPEVRAAYASLDVEDVREKGEWVAAVLRA
jgi:ribosomal protein L11 methyltransferase